MKRMMQRIGCKELMAGNSTLEKINPIEDQLQKQDGKVFPKEILFQWN